MAHLVTFKYFPTSKTMSNTSQHDSCKRVAVSQNLMWISRKKDGIYLDENRQQSFLWNYPSCLVGRYHKSHVQVAIINSIPLFTVVESICNQFFLLLLSIQWILWKVMRFPWFLFGYKKLFREPNTGRSWTIDGKRETGCKSGPVRFAFVLISRNVQSRKNS